MSKLILTHECECGEELEYCMQIIDSKKKNFKIPASFLGNFSFECEKCGKEYITGEFEIFDREDLG